MLLEDKSDVYKRAYFSAYGITLKLASSEWAKPLPSVNNAGWDLPIQEDSRDLGV